MTLHHEVLALLGEDATPEKAVERLNKLASINDATFSLGGVFEGRDESTDRLLALSSYAYRLAAAAIRECEARRKHVALSELCGDAVMSATPEEMLKLAGQRDEAFRERGAAMVAYDALRNWRKR